MQKELKIEINEVVCDNLQYLFNSCESYERVIKSVLENDRDININKELFTQYTDEYKAIYNEMEALKSSIIDEYFVSIYKEVPKYSYYVDFVNHLLIVNLEA